MVEHPTNIRLLSARENMPSHLANGYFLCTWQMAENK
jgi:hypothetical protein